MEFDHILAALVDDFCHRSRQHLDHVPPQLQRNAGYGALMAASLSSSLPRAFLLLTKPGIIVGNGITAAAGFALGSSGVFYPFLFLAALAGLSLIIGSACVLNNYIDRNADRKMKRTKNRALATGSISIKHALVFAALLVSMGSMILFFFVNLLSTVAALFGFLAYVGLYTYSKYHTVHGTLIGSLSGAVPPIVGYAAAGNRLDLTALIFFAVLVFWQMPHFYAIAIYRLKEYQAASIPVLPAQKGIHAAKIQMILYIVAFAVMSLLLAFSYGFGAGYISLSIFLSFGWLALAIAGLHSKNDTVWARSMFSASLAVILGLSFYIFVAAFL